MADAQPVLDLIEAFRRSKVMFTAVSLGLFDRLEKSPADAAELAREQNLDANALERLLDACVALGLLERAGDRCRNLPVASRYLRRESPDTLTGYILYSDRILYPIWGHLEDAVREGTHRWEQTFGGKAGIFDELFSTEDSKLTFLAGMHGMGLLSSPAVIAALDLSRFSHLCDLGGATGHLAIEACRHYPKLRATIFDLPGVAAVAQQYIEAAALAGRMDTCNGDFFSDPLPEADLYSLGRILHDWSEPKIVTLLERIYRQLPPAGGLLVAEKILYPRKDGPASANLQSLNMLVVTEGKERTAAEYEALLRRAGFREFHARSTGRHLDAMLAIK
ncbi:MAG TPA: class I SAM-dependent methyltransferase [Bryobacterales bacterium]|nr:class I SAM-dependent methyltransferase [Bryobacterales bacterium]